MGFPAYYLTTASPPTPVVFPLGERIGSSPRGRDSAAISRESTDIAHETEEGVLWVYPQARRRIWALTFRCYTEAHLTFFETLHLAVNGQADPFYFLPDVSAPSEVYLVRKEKDFQTQSVDATGASGAIIGVFDYTLTMREESAAAYILT